jgi:hypothetical protein
LAQLPDDTLVDATFVARALGVSTRQVRRLEGLAVVVVSDRVHRYRVGDLRAWIAGKVVAGPLRRPVASSLPTG